jgi:hypothetical protein
MLIAAVAQSRGAELVFTSATDLLRWTASVRVKRSPARLRVELPGLTLDQKKRWQGILERSHNDCGCVAAALALLLFLVALGIYGVAVGFRQSLLLVGIASIVGSIGATGAGKVLGLTSSRRKFRREVAQLVALAPKGQADGLG